MPKKELRHLPGERLADPLADCLRDLFGAEQVSSLEQYGGTISVTISSAKKRAARKGGKLVDVHALKRRLEEVRESDIGLTEFLKELTSRELEAVAAKYEHRFRSSARVAEMRSELHRVIRGDATWRKIASHSRAD